MPSPFGVNGAKPLSKRHFHFTFGNDLTRAESDLEWERSAVNSYNRVFFEGVTRTHRIVSQDGWEEVADYALTWATSHAAAAPVA
ncbi:hypothetical protein [Microbacterium telephonicum]|uniref:Uncharacterized protein n=1 Tax=Microbacterium telephonicum TaxID=1714841 RepID=A0A498C980_9MICO|nr:hypothetical protein [Microbacterium telephonicum]RLK52093.1 hypothetical protein C7474_0019 [Microbacterium telephonicum]